MKVNPIIYQLMNVVAVVAVLIMNSLVNLLPLNGVTTAQVSDSYPNLFTPPGYVFSIWGIIYAFSVVFMLYQARPSERSKDYLKQISFLYPVSALANISWLFLFQYSYGVPRLLLVSLIPMGGLLLSLITIYMRLGIGRSAVSRNEKLAVHLPISIYLGWISLAIIANIAAVLNDLIPGISILVQADWTVVVLVLVLVLTTTMIWTRGDLVFGLVVIWASIGIALNRVAIPFISVTAIVTCTMVGILILFTPFLKKNRFRDFYMSTIGR